MTAHQAQTVLIVTLGGKPQIVTFALDLLQLRHGLKIDRVCALHFSRSANPRIHSALRKLENDFAARQPGITFESVEICETHNGMARPIAETDDRVAAHATWMTAHRLFTTLRQKGDQFELCVTGGPRLIALQTLSVATLLFAPHDHCWHVYTPTDVREKAGEGNLLYLDDYSAAGLQLIEIPLLPMSLLMPGLQIAAAQSPDQIISERREWIEATEARRCREVMGRLTAKQRAALREYARERADTARVRQALGIAESTLDSHRRVILAECRVAWGLAENTRLTHHFLRDKFGRLPDSFWGEWVRKNRGKP